MPTSTDSQPPHHPRTGAAVQVLGKGKAEGKQGHAHAQVEHHHVGELRWVGGWAAGRFGQGKVDE